MAKLSKLKVTTGAAGATKDYFFLGNAEFYAGGVGTAAGIVAATDAEKDEPLCSIGQMLRSGLLIRLNGTTGTVTSPKNVRFLAAVDKLSAVLSLPATTTVPGGTLRAIRVARKAVSY